MKFRNANWFLSNFYPAEVAMNGAVYPTVEHAYQAAKFDEGPSREAIAACATPGEAKRLGRKLPGMRAGWSEDRIPVMTSLLRKKFFNHPDLRAKLVDTGTTWLAEDNTWNDRFWGVCGGRGENWLGRLLMQVRSEIEDDAKHMALFHSYEDDEDDVLFCEFDSSLPCNDGDAPCDQCPVAPVPLRRGPLWVNETLLAINVNDDLDPCEREFTAESDIYS